MTIPLSTPRGFDNSLPRERATCHVSRVERGNPSDICATDSTPVAAALILKGISPGVALVFLLAGPATNITSLAVLLGTLGKRTTAIYLATIALSSVLFRLAVDQIYGCLGFAEQAGIGLPEDEIRSITTGRFPFWHKKLTISYCATNIKLSHSRTAFQV